MARTLGIPGLMLMAFSAVVLCSSFDKQTQLYAEYMQNEEFVYLNLLYRIRVEMGYRTCLIYGNRRNTLQQGFLERKLNNDLETPLLIYSEQTVRPNALTFNKEMLVIVYLDGLDVLTVLDNLAANLKDLLNAPIVFVWTNLAIPSQKHRDLDLLFRACWHHKLLNAITIFQDFAITKEFYSYTIFPQFRIAVKRFEPLSQTQIFPSKVRNLQGYAIRTTFEKMSSPNAIKINIGTGRIIVDSANKLLALLYEKLNATVQNTHVSDTGFSLQRYRKEIFKLITNDTIDVMTGLASPWDQDDWKYFSYPFIVAQRCVFVLKSKQPSYSYADFFTKYLSWVRQLQVALICFSHLVLLLLNHKWQNVLRKENVPIHFPDIVLNMHVFASILGLPFQLPRKPNGVQRLSVIFLSLGGLIYSTSILVRLQLFLNLSAAETLLSTFEDLQQSGIKIALSRFDYNVLTNNTQGDFSKYSHLVKIINNYKGLWDPSEGPILNSKYAYAYTITKYADASLYDKLKYRSTIRPTKICVKPFFYLAFPLQRNSFLKEPLQEIIIRTQDMGLLSHWLLTSFRSVLKSSIWNTHATNPDKLVHHRLSFKDFKSVWIFILILFSLSVLVFVFELVWFRRKKK